MTNNISQSHKTGKLIAALILSFILYVPFFSTAQQEIEEKTLILYYSRTDKTKACCEALQQVLGADIVEIKDLVDRSGRWGYNKAVIGSLLNWNTKIKPKNPDFSIYSNIIIASPIWSNKLSIPILTLIDNNQFDEKKVVLFTTTNAYVKEKHKEKSKAIVKKAGGNVVGYYQVLTKEMANEFEEIDRPTEHIIEDTLKFVPQIQKVFL